MLKKTLISAVPLALAACATTPPTQQSSLSALPATGTVEARFLSYNIEMAEVTGGNFWKPYGSPAEGGNKAYRGPIDLDSPKLRQLAAALAPAYVRYSGTWANATWFADSENVPATAPAGFDTVLTRKQWRSAVDFARKVDARILTSFATSPGTRDSSGVWQTDVAARWLAYTHEIGGEIAAAEYVNEPSMLNLIQPPEGYTSADYRRDYARFVRWIRKASPRTLVLAPGTAELGEPIRTLSRQTQHVIETDELLGPDSPKPDVFSFHYYGGSSERCGGAMMGTTLANALTPKWLDSVDVALRRLTEERDRITPGLPMWNTESAEAACGGNPWAASFADSFRFVDTLGRSARQGVRVFMHNTLAASDYALLDEKDFTPRPNYWAAVLWKRTMGTTVLAAPASPSPELRLYAHCLPGGKGGVGLAAINIGTSAQSVPTGSKASVWVMTGEPLDTRDVRVNGQKPALAPSAELTGLTGASVQGDLILPGKAIAFLSVAGANNPACH